MIIDLTKPDLTKLDVGTQVKTTTGFIWTKFSHDSWIDETSGLRWLPKEPNEMNHDSAMNLEDDTKRLPSKEEFEEAEEHGIREVLDFKNQWFWSASVHPRVAHYAFYFSGGGVIYYDPRDDEGAVRCVGR